MPITRTDLGHGRGWLDAAPAASVVRIDRQLGRPMQITEAGRTPERQQELRDLYLAGQGAYALPAGESEHEVGNAVDSNEWFNPTIAAVLEDNGWRRTALARGEGWHGEYFPDLDNHRNDPTTPRAGDKMETIIVAPNDVVVHFRNGGKTNYADEKQYNTFRNQVIAFKKAGATNIVTPPPLADVPKVSWDTFNFLADYHGAPRG